VADLGLLDLRVREASQVRRDLREVVVEMALQEHQVGHTTFLVIQ